MGRLKQAQALGWTVEDSNRDRAILRHKEVKGEHIEVWVDGDWMHIKDQSGFGSAVLWDSGATRVKPRQFVPYLKRLVTNHIKEDLRLRMTCHTEPRTLPYPWCIGNPTKQDCLNAGYCRKDPNCGE
jgi:hypothetical protein